MGLEAGKTPGPLPVQRTGDAAAIAAADEDGKDRDGLIYNRNQTIAWLLR